MNGLLNTSFVAFASFFNVLDDLNALLMVVPKPPMDFCAAPML
jgi:hypothetical protein